MKKMLILICFIAFFNKTNAQTNNNTTNIQSLLTETWINEDDSLWKVVFNENGLCYWYYNNQITETFTYLISVTNPQCGYNVVINTGEDFYLQLVDPEDATITCYEILGVDNESLSLSLIGEINVKYYFLKQ
jgi:hypothetical protein